MKWIRRKPSKWVHSGVFVVSVLVLAVFFVWISGPPRKIGSKAGGWLRSQVLGPTMYTGLPERPSCFVLEEHGKVRLLNDGYSPDIDLRRKHPITMRLYELGIQPSGFFASTSVRVFHSLSEHSVIQRSNPPVNRSFPDAFFASSSRWGLGLTPDDDGYIAVDGRLIGYHFYYEDRTLRSGYAINSVALLALSGILWSLAWVPYQIRQWVRWHRFTQGLCPLCRYDVSATPGRCPECGWGHEDEGNGDVSEGNGA